MLLPAVAVLAGDTSAAAAADLLDGYADDARLAVRRRVDRWLFWYVLPVGEVRRRLHDAPGDRTLEEALELAAVEAASTLQVADAAADLGDFAGVVLEGDRVVGIADPGIGAPAVDGAPGVAAGPPGDRGFSSRMEGAGEVRQAEVVPVYFATDRRSEGEWRGKLFHGGRRGELSFGVAEVSLPRDHRIGRLERPPFWFPRESADRHVVVLTVEALERGAFIDRARADAGRLAGREALLFVHGFNVGFPEALRRTAQLAFDLATLAPGGDREGGRPGYLPLLYSWPSQGSVGGYMTDETNARWTVEHFEEALRLVMTELGVRVVHVVAHSMGNRVLIETLRTLDTTALPAGSARLREVIFAAPDFDADTFRDFAARFHHRADGFTLYASSHDRALLLSRKLRRDLQRAGESGEGLVVVEGVETIDASDVMRGDFLRHSYFAERTVLGDMVDLLDRDLDAARRPLLEADERDGVPYWRFREAGG